MKYDVTMLQNCSSEQLKTIKDFYKTVGYGGADSCVPENLFFVAKLSANIIGCCRLCKEFGILIMRGVHVHEQYQRQGIGTALIQALCLEVDRQQKVCYCIPYNQEHLKSLYGKYGFVVIANEQAPLDLQKRLKKYCDDGLDVIIMKREAHVQNEL